MSLWYLSHRWPAKARRIRAVSPEPSLFAHMKYESRRRIRPKIRHLAPLDGCAYAFEKWAYRVRKSHDMAHIQFSLNVSVIFGKPEVHPKISQWYLSHRWPAKARRIRAVSPEPSLFAHMKYESRRRIRPKIRHLAPLDGCAYAFEKWAYRVRKSHDMAQIQFSLNVLLFSENRKSIPKFLSGKKLFKTVTLQI